MSHLQPKKTDLDIPKLQRTNFLKKGKEFQHY